MVLIICALINLIATLDCHIFLVLHKARLFTVLCQAVRTLYSLVPRLEQGKESAA